MLTHRYTHASVLHARGSCMCGLTHTLSVRHRVLPTNRHKRVQIHTHTYTHARAFTHKHTHTHRLANAAHKYKVMCAYTVSICTGMHRYDVANVYMRVTAYIDVRACTANIYICIGLCVRAWTYVHAHMYIYIGMRVTAYIDYVHVDIHPQLCVFSPKMLSEY